MGASGGNANGPTPPLRAEDRTGVCVIEAGANDTDAADGEASSVRGVQGDGWESVPIDFAPITWGTATESPLVALRLPSLEKTCTVETGAFAKASAGGEEMLAGFFSPVAPSMLPQGETGNENFSSSVFVRLQRDGQFERDHFDVWVEIVAESIRSRCR